MRAVDVSHAKDKKTNDEFKDMFDSVTNEEIIDENIRKAGVEKMISEKKLDTGL